MPAAVVERVAKAASIAIRIILLLDICVTLPSRWGQLGVIGGSGGRRGPTGARRWAVKRSSCHDGNNDWEQ